MPRFVVSLSAVSILIMPVLTPVGLMGSTMPSVPVSLVIDTGISVRNLMVPEAGRSVVLRVVGVARLTVVVFGVLVGHGLTLIIEGCKL